MFTPDSRGFCDFRGFRDFRESSAQLLVCSCLSCRRRFVIFLKGDPHANHRFGNPWKDRSSKDEPGLPKVPQNSAEPLGFCQKFSEVVVHKVYAPYLSMSKLNLSAPSDAIFLRLLACDKSRSKLV